MQLFTESQLVSFAEYLLSNPQEGANNKPYVSDGVLSAWKETQTFNNILPSAHQIGELASFGLNADVEPMSCTIIKVHFTESKVTYDIQVSLYGAKKGEDEYRTRLYNVDSAFISSHTPKQIRFE